MFYDTKNLRTLTNESYSLLPFDPVGYRNARDAYCGKSKEEVDQLIASKPELRKFFTRVCFDATYLEVLLTHVYGLDDETLSHMVFAKNVSPIRTDLMTFVVFCESQRKMPWSQVDGVDVGWSLGWAVSVATDNQIY